MHERLEREESPSTCVAEWVSLCNFCLALYSFRPPSRALVVITLRGGMPLGAVVKYMG